MNFFDSKKDVVQFVRDLLDSLKLTSVSITIISPKKYVVSYVPTATVWSLEDFEKIKDCSFSEMQSSI